MTRKCGLILVLGTLCLSGCGVPQIGLDRAAFQAVDALYTAVSLRDPKLLEACESNLNRLRAEQKLPDDAGRASTVSSPRPDPATGRRPRPASHTS